MGGTEDVTLGQHWTHPSRVALKSSLQGEAEDIM